MEAIILVIRHFEKDLRDPHLCVITTFVNYLFSCPKNEYLHRLRLDLGPMYNMICEEKY